MYLTLEPAYGRDYTSKANAQADWQAGKDFLIANNFHPYNGKPLSVNDSESIASEGYLGVLIRFNKLRHIVTIPIKKG